MKGYRRLAWWLVWAYPPRFRRDVGLGLVDALEDRMRARRASGSATGIIWLRACLDTLHNASAEWLDCLRDGIRDGLKAGPYRSGYVSGDEYSGRSLDRSSQNDRPRGRTMIDKLWQDLRYAIRTWTKRPTVAIVAILTPAVGIRANPAMFSIVNALLLR